MNKQSLKLLFENWDVWPEQVNDVIFLDLETSIKNRGEDAIGKHKSSPYFPDNRICYAGMIRGDGTYCSTKLPAFSAPRLLVAQNASFDLQWLMKADRRWVEHLQNSDVCIWDTMTVEYLLTGQHTKWASLDTLALKYGGTVKDSRIKEYWEKGIDTEDIPEEEILPYLEQDVKNLQIIFEAQLAEAERLEMIPLIQSQMRARKWTSIMEYNGMAFDTNRALEEGDELQRYISKAEGALREAMSARFPEIPKEQLNPGSSKQISVFYFGGELTYKDKVAMLDGEGNHIKYKSGKKRGQYKYKNEMFRLSYEKMLFPTKPMGKSGSYPVGEKEIKELEDKTGFSELLLKYRECKKNYTTYFDGLRTQVFPDGCLHGNINHSATDTGRTSSSQPNLQNISGKESGKIYQDTDMGEGDE